MSVFLICVIGIWGPNFSLATVWEPTISYKTSRFEEGSGNKANLNGPSIGGKVSWPVGPNLSLGFDGNLALLELEPTHPSQFTDPATEQQCGLFFTFNFKTFKASSSYLFLNRLIFTNKEWRGDAVKIGLGIPIVETLWASFDFIRPHFYQAIGISPRLPNNADTIMLSLSYLFNP